MKRSRKVFIITVLFILGSGSPIMQAAQDMDEEVSTVTLVISPACKLDIINSKVSKEISFDNNAKMLFSEGFVEFDLNSPILIVYSNNKWKLSARSSDFTGPYPKDVADLLLKDLSNNHVKAGFTDYRPLSAQDQDIAMHIKGVRDEQHPLQYKILLDWEKDVPGTYEATITYTLSTIGS